MTLRIQGERFGRLTAIEPAGRRHRCIAWRFACDCGGQAVLTPREARQRGRCGENCPLDGGSRAGKRRCRREQAIAMRGQGMSLARIGQALGGISKQRVLQLLQRESEP